MEKLIKILMERDGMDYEDARLLILETRDEIIENPDEAEDIILEYLGLEIDYIFDIL